MDKDEIVNRKQENEEVAKVLLAMKNTRGWHIFSEHIELLINKNNLLSSIDLSKPEEVYYNTRLAQSKRDLLKELLKWVDNKIHKGGQSGK